MDWWGGGHGVLPSHIWCFVDLKGLPLGRSTLEYGGIQLQDGVHAIVEVATYDEEPDEDAQDEDVVPSDLFVPLHWKLMLLMMMVMLLQENSSLLLSQPLLLEIDVLVPWNRE